MHKKNFWKLRKIPCNVKPTETNSCQRFRILRVNLAYVSNSAKKISYLEWVYRWKISIYDLKMKFWFQ